MHDILPKMSSFNLFCALKFWHFLKGTDKLRLKKFMQNYEKQIQLNLQK